MTSRNRIKMLVLAALLVHSLSGCILRVTSGSRVWNLNIGPKATPQPTYTPYPSYTPRPTYTPLPPNTPRPTYTFLPLETMPAGDTPVPSGGEISQFATTATASSQYSSTSWSAAQATGAPDTPICGDQSTAWASLHSYGKDWLLLNYDNPVIPTRIVIYQTYHPGAVSLVEVIDEAGKAITVFSAIPANISECPYNLEIEIKDVNTLVRSIRVTIDQSSHNGWNEIDAVQLVGNPN